MIPEVRYTVFTALAKIETAGQARKATALALRLAQNLTPPIYFYTSLQRAVIGVTEYQKELDTLPSDERIDFKYNLVSRLYVELAAQEGVTETLEQISYVREFDLRAQEVKRTIFKKVADTAADVATGSWAIVLIVVVVTMLLTRKR